MKHKELIWSEIECPCKVHYCDFLNVSKHKSNYDIYIMKLLTQFINKYPLKCLVSLNLF